MSTIGRIPETRRAYAIAPIPITRACTITLPLTLWPGQGEQPAQTMTERDSFAVSQALNYLTAKRAARGD